MPEAQTKRRFPCPALDHEALVGHVDVVLQYEFIRWSHKLGKGAILELGDSVREVLRKPLMVFSGIRRDADEEHCRTEGWLCYSGVPLRRYDLGTGEPKEPESRVLLVFVSDELVVYTARWEQEDPHREGLPLDRDDRFERELL